MLAPAPMRIGAVTLTVHDLPSVRDFYRDVVGLGVLRQDAAEAVLGAGDAPLLVLRADKAARSRAAREAGLFHTAFLLPHRADLARWVAMASARRVAVQGASDHLVSEAIYLADPEGNGVEIYSDRPPEAWPHKDGMVQMATERLDIPGLLQATGGQDWAGAPEGTTVGHVHLQVGALEPAEAFYNALLGFDITCRYPGGTFYSSGGYHHHLATNIWNSRGAGPRDLPSSGLTDVQVLLGDAAARDAMAARVGADAQGRVRDPWGTELTLAVG